MLFLLVCLDMWCNCRESLKLQSTVDEFSPYPYHCQLFTIINNCWELSYQENTKSDVDSYIHLRLNICNVNDNDNNTLSYLLSKESDKTINYLKIGFAFLCESSFYDVQKHGVTFIIAKACVTYFNGGGSSRWSRKYCASF